MRIVFLHFILDYAAFHECAYGRCYYYAEPERRRRLPPL